MFGLAASYLLISILQLPLGLAFTGARVDAIRVLGGITIALGVVGLVIAIGLWGLRFLAYVFAILLTVFNLGVGVFFALKAEGGGGPALLIGLGVNFAVLALLGKATTAKVFGGSYPGRPSDASFTRPVWHTSPYFWAVTVVSIGCNLLPLASLLLVVD